MLFDLGGTLLTYASRERLAHAADVALTALGLDTAAPEVRAARQQAAHDVELEYSARPSFLHRDLFRERIARTASLLGVEAPDAVLDQFTVDNTRNLVLHLPPRPDAVATLAALRARHIYCAVVSNADCDFLDASLREHGLHDLLDDWTSSEEADSCKPDPGIYRHTLHKSGRPRRGALRRRLVAPRRGRCSRRRVAHRPHR